MKRGRDALEKSGDDEKGVVVKVATGDLVPIALRRIKHSTLNLPRVVRLPEITAGPATAQMEWGLYEAQYFFEWLRQETLEGIIAKMPYSLPTRSTLCGPLCGEEDLQHDHRIKWAFAAQGVGEIRKQVVRARTVRSSGRNKICGRITPGKRTILMSLQEVCAVRLWQLTNSQLKAVLKIQRLNLVADDSDTVEMVGLACLGSRSQLFELALSSCDTDATRLLRIYLAVRYQHLLYAVVLEDDIELELILDNKKPMPKHRLDSLVFCVHHSLGFLRGNSQQNMTQRPELQTSIVQEEPNPIPPAVSYRGDSDNLLLQYGVFNDLAVLNRQTRDIYAEEAKSDTKSDTKDNESNNDLPPCLADWSDDEVDALLLGLADDDEDDTTE